MDYVVVVSLIHVLVGVGLFLYFGGVFPSAPGLFALGSVFFLGIPPLWMKAAGYANFGQLSILASGIACSSMMTVVGVAGLVGGGQWSHRRIPVVVQGTPLKWGLVLSFTGVTLGMLLELIGPSSLAGAIHYVTVVAGCALAVLSFASKRHLVSILACATTLTSLVAFFMFHFHGFGRLVLVSLGMSGVLLVSQVWRSRSLKALVLVMAVPFLMYAGSIRSSVPDAVGFVHLLDPTVGLGSLLAPYYTFEEIVAGFGHFEGPPQLEYQWGRTMLASILFWVPRELWPTKPFGLGYQLTLWFRPHLAPAGHSMAASYLGELFLNFGVFGVLAGPFLLGYVLGRWDRLIHRLFYRSQPFTFIRYWQLVSITLLVTGLFDYVWGSTFTFAARTGFRMMIWLPIGIAYKLLRQAGFIRLVSREVQRPI